MTPTQPRETREMRLQRQRAEADNVKQIQENVQDRTRMFRRILSPRQSLVTGAISTRMTL